MNAIHLIGRLTKDPDMRYLPGTETASTNFQIAVRRNFKNRKREIYFYNRSFWFWKEYITSLYGRVRQTNKWRGKTWNKKSI